MNEYEYNQMLDDVAWAMDEGFQDNLPKAKIVRMPLRAANDNYLEWPMLPFPDGWNASC
uniref:Uncharacterized protein n=1 Tax=Rhodopseudomonas palustris (strain BisA53) TaxID=316055 RepID=Q07N02_RHOP5